MALAAPVVLEVLAFGILIGSLMMLGLVVIVIRAALGLLGSWIWGSL